MPVTTCPPLDRLLAGLDGTAGSDGTDELAAHLEHCSSCQQRLEQCSSRPDSLPEQLRNAGDATAWPYESAYHVALARVLDAPVVDRFAPGQMVHEYLLEEPLGAGGMGAVWKARHTRLDMIVAIKFMARRLTGDPAAEERFAREMKAVGRLQHPHIIRAHDAGEEGGRPYLVMEFVPGSDLALLVKSRGSLEVADACEAVRQAAVGLQHAHEAGQVHRDVKPSNLLLTNDGVVKVLDLGLARLGDTDLPLLEAPSNGSTRDSSLTGASRVIGTRDYMAPEQFRDARNVDARADVYALGCTLIYLLTGRPPRPGDEAAVIAKGVPAALLRRCLSPDVAERFPTAAALAQALTPLARGHDLRRAIESATAGTVTKRKSRRAWGIPVAMAALIAALWLGYSLVPAGTNEDTPPTAEEPPALPLAKLPLTTAEAKAIQGTTAAAWDVPVTRNAGLGITMVLIPPGEFGLTTECRATVSKPFAIGSKEITFGQFRQFVEATNYVTEVERSGKGGWRMNRRDYHNMQQQNPKFIWRTPGYDEVTENHPVTQVTFGDAIAFCEWLSAQDNVTYRLPTEVEWRWACRAGTITDYYFGADKSAMKDHAWYLGNAFDQPQPVGQLTPNAWGLYDMLGNVEEWCQDWFGDLPAGPVVDYRGPATGKARVLAGGGHYLIHFDCMTRHTGGTKAAYAFTGFRIAKDVAPSGQ